MPKTDWTRPQLLVLARGSRDELVLSFCKLFSGGPPWPSGYNDAAISCEVKNLYDNCVYCSELGST